MALGTYIQTLREKQNLSIRQLALKSGISHTEIHRIESGKRKSSSPATLKSLAPFLSVTSKDLMIMAGYLDEEMERGNCPKSIPSEYSSALENATTLTIKMIEKDAQWLDIAYRVSEELSPQNRTALKTIIMSILNK